MRADVEKLLLEREAQGLPRTVDEPTALRTVANVIALAVQPRRKPEPKDAA